MTVFSPALAGAASQDSGEKITLVYFNAREGEASEMALIERYMDEHPNIEIEYLASTSLSGPSDTDAISNLIFNIQAETTIDVAKVEVQRTPLDLMVAGANVELSAINPEAVQTRIDELLNANTVQIKGGIWGLPYEYDPFGYIYNADMYREAGLDPDRPPQTWDELRAANQALQAQFPDSWAICHPIKTLNKIQPYVWGAGGRYWNDTVPPTEADVTNQGAIDAYNFIDEWAQNGWLNTEELTGETDIQFMVSRQCAAINYSTIFALQFAVNDPETDWRVAPIPPMDTSHEAANFAGGSALVIPSTTEHPQEALDFMLWLTSAEAQRLKYGLDPALGLAPEDLYDQATPANRAVSDELAEDPTWTQALATTHIPTLPAGGLSPVYSQSYEILASMQERIIRTDADVEAELQAAEQAVQELINQNMQDMPELYQ
jgi:ABC-type glycerol-3-phosphate transport system substrate-binding protein